MSAAAVSAILRRGGLLPVAPGREGLRVSDGRGRVRVVADTGSSRRDAELSTAATEILEAAGYDVELSLDGASILYVSRPSS